ncbi:PIG-L family deacetylase [Streptomyces sp. MST-110588]|nr:PIG-L family deacetylase [Streptomyces sp. MST-110588]
MPQSPPGVRRRHLLQAAAGATAAASAGAGLWAWLAPVGGSGGGSGEGFGGGSGEGTPPPRPDAGRPEAAAAGSGQAHLHIIAHADDSLYFMNPDLEQSVRGGARTVTVCLTGGESDGRNAAKGPGFRDTPVDRPGFVRARMNGLRAAHAEMATAHRDSPWDVEAVSFLPGFQVEVQTLRAAPRHQLIFMELIEARHLARPRPTSLRGLWLGAAETLPTLRPAGTPVRQSYAYTRDQVIETLIAILDRVRPTVVRTLDPNAVHAPREPLPSPDPRLRGPFYYDHQDHTTSAYFAQAALAGYWGRARAGRGGTVRHVPAVVENYLGYEVGVLPNNLDIRTARRKGDLLSVYGWADHRACADPAGCGDRKVGGEAFDGWSRNWTRSTRLRAPGSNAWLRPGKDGRLVAFAVLDGQAHCWAETSPGSGSFRGPYPLGGDLLQGQIHAVRHPGGTLQLFATRTILPGRDRDRGQDGDGDRAHRREVVAALQTGTAQDGVPTFAAWESLGCPDADPVKSLEMGFPAAVAVADGTVHVFVRDRDGRIACRSGAHGGRWSPWQRLERPAGPSVAPEQTPQVIDGLDACVDSDGLVHLVAPSGNSVRHWVSQAAGQLPRPAAATGLPEPAGPVSVVALDDGAVRIAFRQPATARILLAERRRTGGVWHVVAQCEPAGGHGRVAMAAVGGAGGAAGSARGGERAAAGGWMVLAARDDAGLVRVALAGTARRTPQPWRTGKVLHSAAPGVAADARGRAVAVALGNDGRLYATRQKEPGTDDAFGPWTAQVASGTEQHP